MGNSLETDTIRSAESAALKEKITEISDQFMREAMQSPTLLADMASMEKYMAESYSGRIFIELLQNADDCKSKKVAMIQSGTALYFANDGRPFDEDDIVSICRSGSSSKQRGENIGYRGVGFKSATYLSDEIIIHSGGVGFTFSKKHCSTLLNTQEENVPTVRIPFCIDKLESSCQTEISILKQQGYETVFVFLDARLPELYSELNELESGHFLFLNNILECRITTDSHDIDFRFDRKKHKLGYDFIGGSNTSESWRVINGERSALAIKIENNEFSECDAKDALYHSYLPTHDKAPFRMKINSDFSTDPSRKHLTVDDFTKTALHDIAFQIFNLIQSVFLGEGISGSSRLLSIFSEQHSFSQANSILISSLKDKLASLKLELTNGKIISASEYKLFPNWLNEAEIKILRKYSHYAMAFSLPNKIYDNYFFVDRFISAYSDAQFTTEDMIEIITDEELFEKLNSETHGKIVAKIINDAKIQHQVSGLYVDVDRVLKTIVDDTDKVKDFELGRVIDEQLSTSDLNWVKSMTKIKLSEKKEKVSSPILQSKPLQKSEIATVTKWRSAEQQAIQIEEHYGNKAIDVSKKNLGYDIESTTADGSKRYIEVKSLQNNYSGFSITNNEYTSAHQLGNEYFICLIFENKAIYIQNPIENLYFEKRIRQWEWLCEQYSGYEIKINTK